MATLVTREDLFKCENQKTKDFWKVTGCCVFLLTVIILAVTLSSNR